jgi:hypothetical protein
MFEYLEEVITPVGTFRIRRPLGQAAASLEDDGISTASDCLVWRRPAPRQGGAYFSMSQAARIRGPSSTACLLPTW